MKISKKLRSLGYYLLGLATFPIIFLILNIFQKEEIIDSSGYEGILFQHPGASYKQYKFDGKTAFILDDSLDIKNLQFGTEKDFIGVDLTEFSVPDRSYYSNILDYSVSLKANLTETDKLDYIEYLKLFKRRGKCTPKSPVIPKNQYVLDVVLKGEKLLLKTFEFGDYNYSNPGCFIEQSKGFSMENLIEITNTQKKVPFKVKIISDGKEKNSYEFKMTLKDYSGKVVYKYPKATEFEKGEIKNLSSKIYIENEVDLNATQEAIAK